MHAPRLPLMIAILAALFLAACGSSVPPPDFDPSDADWCYTYDFTTSSYGASLSSGEWVNGVGFRSIGGNLGILISHSQNVAPSLIRSSLQVVYAGNVSFSASYNIFGISESISDTLPDFIEVQEIQRTPSSANTYGSTASLSISSPAVITVSNLQVYGLGTNPFPSNSCGASPTGTNTPNQLPTLTPSNTPTATGTPTTTPMPTATTNASYDWCVVYDFTQDDYDFVTTDIGFGWSGNGNESRFGEWSSAWLPSLDVRQYASGDFSMHYGLYINKTIESARYVGFRYIGSYEAGRNIAGYPNAAPSVELIGSWTVTATPDVGGSIDFTHLNPAQTNIANDMRISVKVSTTSTADNDNGAMTPPSPLGSASLEYLILYGKDTPPSNTSSSCTPSSPTPTPSPTFTPSPTYTPSPSPTAYPECGFVNSSFSNGLSGWSNSGAGAVPGAAELEDGDSISQDMNVPDGDYQLRIVASALDNDTGSGFAEIAFSESLDSEADSLSNSLSAFQNANNQLTYEFDFSLTSTGSRTFSFSADLTGSITAIRIESICIYSVSEGADDGGGDGSDDSSSNGGGSAPGFSYQCGETITAPPLSVFEIGNWIIFLARVLLQWFQCVLLGFIIAILSAIGNLILMAISFFNFIGSAFLWLWGVVSNFAVMIIYSIIGRLFNAGIETQSVVIQTLAIAAKAMNIVINYTGIAQAYIGAATYQTVRIMAAYNAAPAIPPPGLPNCLTAPLDSDLCAVYYVAENTVLAGTLGSLIIPVITIYIDVITLLYLLNIVRKFIANAREIFND